MLTMIMIIDDNVDDNENDDKENERYNNIYLDTCKYVWWSTAKSMMLLLLSAMTTLIRYKRCLDE